MEATAFVIYFSGMKKVKTDNAIRKSDAFNPLLSTKLKKYLC